MRIRKCNAVHGSATKKELKFLSPPPIEQTITKSKFQTSEANASLADNHSKFKIAKK